MDKQKADKERMRRTFHQDMLAFKQKEIAQMQYHNSRFMGKDEIIPVQFYDSLSGLDPETMEIVKQKIAEVKEMAQLKISAMIEQNEKNTEKINKYKELAPEDYTLLEYEIEDLIKMMPKLCKDVNLLWGLLLSTYG